MNKPNQDVRSYGYAKGVPMWRVAEKKGIHESQLSRLLRHELEQEQKAEILNIIDQIALQG